MQLFFIAAVVFAAFCAVFALQNNVPVTVTFLLWRFDSSLAMVLLLSLFFGGLIVALVSTPATLRRQWTIRRLMRRIAELEKFKTDEQKPQVVVVDAGHARPGI